MPPAEDSRVLKKTACGSLESGVEMAKWIALCCVLAAIPLTLSCSDSPAERAAKHERRGDGYVQQEKFREALIECKNAARATPDNASIQWKLARAASQFGDPVTAGLTGREPLEKGLDNGGWIAKCGSNQASIYL